MTLRERFERQVRSTRRFEDDPVRSIAATIVGVLLVLAVLVFGPLVLR